MVWENDQEGIEKKLKVAYWTARKKIPSAINKKIVENDLFVSILSDVHLFYQGND